MAGAGGYQYQPDHCWALERVPWWEPPYLLHNGREEVRLGRKENNTKVCQGHQVSRNHVLFVRTGAPDEWHSVRWSVVDQGGVCGTFVNQVRIVAHEPFPLNADDLIGVGTGDPGSTRVSGKETFVYKIRAPRAFQHLDTDDDEIDLLDGDAPTPPPAEVEHEEEEQAIILPDLVLAAPVKPFESEPSFPANNIQPVPAALPSPLLDVLSSSTNSSSIQSSRSSCQTSSSPKKQTNNENISLSSGGGATQTVSFKLNRLGRQQNNINPARVANSNNTARVAPANDDAPPLDESKSKSGHKLEVITLDSSDEESVRVKKEGDEVSNVLKLGLKRKRKKSGDSKGNSKKIKQIFGSDSENETIHNESESQETCTSANVSGSSASTESLKSVSHLTEQFSPFSSDDEGFLSPVTAKVDTSPGIYPVNLNNRGSKECLEDMSHSTSVDLRNNLQQESVVLNSSSKPEVRLPKDSSEPVPMKDAPSKTKSSDLNSKKLPLSPETDLVKLAEKIKAAKMKAVGSEKYSPTTVSDVKLVLPVFSIKKELPDSELPPISLAVGYSHEPEVITICDSEDEEEYDAKHSQSSGIFDEVDDVTSDGIKEEVVSDSEEFFCNELVDDEDEEEIQILQSSENKLFAAISKRIKVEFDESRELNQLDDEESDDNDMISKVMDEVGCDENMAVCAIAQAKEIYACDDPSVEQVVQVITGEEEGDNVTGEEDDSSETVETMIALIESDKTVELDHPSNNIHDLSRSPSVCSDSKDSVDDLLLGLDDDILYEKNEKTSPKRNKLKSPKKKMLSDLFDDDDNDEIVKEKESYHPKKLTPSTIEIKSSSPKSMPSGARLIEPMAMPKKRGLSQKSSNASDVERKKMLETLQKSKPKSGNKFFIRRQDSSESKEQIAAERKQKLAEIAAKNKKVDIVKEITAPVGIMKMSKPKSQNLLLEMSSFDTMQPKRKKTKPKVDMKRPKLSKTVEVTKEHLNLPPYCEKKDPSPEVERSDLIKLDEDKKKLYAETSDGYIVPKKISVSNIEYSTVQQEPEVVVRSNVEINSILKKKGKVSVFKKRVQWKDQNGFHCLVEVRDIPAANIGIKCNSKNNKDGCVVVNNKNKNASPKTIKKDVLMDDIFQSILNWNTAWLEEQKKMSDPPPVHQPWQLIPVTNTFSNWEEYRKIFLPLMLQELWSSITKEYEEKKGFGEDIVPVCLQEVSQDTKGRFLIVRCVSLLTELEVRRDFGCEGTLVQLNFSFNLGNAPVGGKQAREIKPSFGFIQNIKKYSYRKGFGNFGEFDLERIKRLENLAAKNPQRKGVLNNLMYYTVKVKLHLAPPGRKLSSEKPIYMKALSRIRPEMRKFEAILDLPQSRLFDSIVSPEKETLHVPAAGHNLHASIQSIPQLSHLNQCQKQIIVSVSHACVEQPDTPKICLVQGPPGTGKSSTISGLILQILYSQMMKNNIGTMPRILVVAPSNAAVDELAMKLIDLKSRLPEPIRFRILRLGVQKSMHQQVRPYSFDALVGQFITAEARQAKASESLEKDERNKQAAANQIYAEKLKAEADGREDLASKLTRDYKEKVQQIEKIKAELKKPLDTRSRRDLERIAAEKTISGADIILATLSSSLSSQLEKYFVQGIGTSKGVGSLRPISVCIMDEASQCVEPEALIPLKLGFCKLVMVGDHEQLPATVTSRKAQQLDYQQSLFGRLFAYFTGVSGDTCPVLRLYTQYRMHEEIANWPSRYFYGGKLDQGPQDRTSILVPYTVLDVDGTAMQQGGNCWNKEEERIVIAAIQTIKHLVGDKLSIGVITFYAKQKQNICLEVQNRRLSNVIVNTVDGFQGSERDVIIISCVRGGPGGIGFLQDRQRLNVALTRARYCMVVIGNMGTLRSASDMWEELVTNASSRNCLSKLEVKDKGKQENFVQTYLRKILLRDKSSAPEHRFLN